MKQICNISVAFVCTLFCALTFASCGSDDDDIVGTSYKGHEFVDLGLSVKWATCDLGAERPEELGKLFAWGVTTPTENENSFWRDYKHCKGSATTLTKYNDNPEYGLVDNKRVLDLEDDAAHVIWGGRWRMPTISELQELGMNCTFIETTINGIKVYEIKSKKNGNSIFLPQTERGGCLYQSSSRSADSQRVQCAFCGKGEQGIENDKRCHGFRIRPVLK